MLQARIHALTKANSSTVSDASLGPEASLEAPGAGIGLDLLPGDTLAPSPHGFIPSFVKGLTLGNIFSFLSPGTASRPRYAHLNLIPPSLSLAKQLDRAIDAAAANKKSRNKKIAVAFCGSTSDSPDLLHQAMRQAGKRKLPMLLVCHTSPHAENFSAQAHDYGFPGVTVDGHDAVAVYRVATEALAHARRGSGPTLIECKPWSPSNRKPVGRAAAGNPIIKMEEYLTRKGLFDKKFKSAVMASFRRELDAAMQLAHISDSRQ
jgi:TPP-dependent pyruvate/acetoin dehydrogenase alpha subunit